MAHRGSVLYRMRKHVAFETTHAVIKTCTDDDNENDTNAIATATQKPRRGDRNKKKRLLSNITPVPSSLEVDIETLTRILVDMEHFDENFNARIEEQRSKFYDALDAVCPFGAEPTADQLRIKQEFDEAAEKQMKKRRQNSCHIHAQVHKGVSKLRAGNGIEDPVALRLTRCLELHDERFTRLITDFETLAHQLTQRLRTVGTVSTKNEVSSPSRLLMPHIAQVSSCMSLDSISGVALLPALTPIQRQLQPPPSAGRMSCASPPGTPSTVTTSTSTSATPWWSFLRKAVAGGWRHNPYLTG